VEELCARHCPSVLQPIVEQGAEVFLSPWLYLVMGIVFVAEKAMPAIRSQPVFSVGMIQDFLGWFVLGGLVRVVLIGAFVSGVYWLCDQTLAGIQLEAAAEWPTWVAASIAILAGDFLNWFHHWLRHRVGVFWLFHTVHHSQKQMNMFTDLRVHLMEYVIARPISIIPLYWVGLDIPTAFWLSLIVESYTRVYHANLRTDFGPLRHLLVTPQSHRIHHSADPRHWGHNFGVLFTFWDRIFGTQWTGYDEYPETGVPDGRYPNEESVGGLWILTNYLRQLLYPFGLLSGGERDCMGGEALDGPSVPSGSSEGESVGNRSA
jgi:sterol desaturase/sphingolipid hydroxylase (fatty acid hydroxylase superfamily)